jgi:hypothetical protein
MLGCIAQHPVDVLQRAPNRGRIIGDTSVRGPAVGYHTTGGAREQGEDYQFLDRQFHAL